MIMPVIIFMLLLFVYFGYGYCYVFSAYSYRLISVIIIVASLLSLCFSNNVCLLVCPLLAFSFALIDNSHYIFPFAANVVVVLGVASS